MNQSFRVIARDKPKPKAIRRAGSPSTKMMILWEGAGGAGIQPLRTYPNGAGRRRSGRTRRVYLRGKRAGSAIIQKESLLGDEEEVGR